MQLRSIQIKNFRTLEDVRINFRGYYTAISGKNNAGKTSLLRCVLAALGSNRGPLASLSGVDFQDDRTKWSAERSSITIDYEFCISSNFDPGLFRFIEKQASVNIGTEETTISVNLKYDKDDNETAIIRIGAVEIEGVVATEIVEKIRSSQSAIYHASAGTMGPEAMFFTGSRWRAIHEPTFSPAEKTQLAAAHKAVRAKLKRIAKSQKEAMSHLLGRLEDKIAVEFTIPEYAFSRGASLAINLKDKSVEVPLTEWGSGTQNRTRILMALLGANKIRLDLQDLSRSTPILIVEEPESFLHPEAQAIFGRTLRELAREMKIQIIATTHSPYMLCQSDPQSNILLARVEGRNKKPSTVLVNVDEENWMEPFAQVLGLSNSELAPWNDVASSKKTVAIFVEGEMDRKYFEHLGAVAPDLKLASEWEVVPYHGKDTLKNAQLLRLFISKYSRVFVTFDFDASKDVEAALGRIGLKRGADYVAVGTKDPGQGRIEGLVPKRLVGAVAQANPDLLLALEATDAADKKQAREKWKKLILTAFCAEKNYTKSELSGFADLVKAIRSGIKGGL